MVLVESVVWPLSQSRHTSSRLYYQLKSTVLRYTIVNGTVGKVGGIIEMGESFVFFVRRVCGVTSK